MRADPVQLVDLASVPSEFEAATIVEALRAQGIAAHHYGGSLAGFRAEAPGMVRVVVRRQDSERARLALRAIQADSIDIDWDEVDVGQPEEPVRESLPDGSGYRCTRCGYRVDHLPPERPCPQCGATVRGDDATIPAAGAGAMAGNRRRARVKLMMAEVSLGMGAFFLAWLLAMPAVVWISIGVATLIMVGWAGVVFLRGEAPGRGGAAGE